MKILIVTFCSPWGMGEYVKNTLIKMGHNVKLFYTNSEGKFIERVFNRAKYLKFQRHNLTKIWQSQVNQRLLKTVAAFRPELLFVIKGDEIFPEVLADIKNNYKTILLNWLPDNPFYLGLENVLKAIPIYDYIFTLDPAHLPQLKAYAKGVVDFLPLCCQPEIHRKINLTEEEIKQYSCDICFIGTALPERTEILKKLLDYNLGVWGEGWQKERYWLKEHYRGKASDEKMVKIYNASKIALNIHHPQALEGANLRTFEICGSGTFQLVDNRMSLLQLFRVGKEIVSFKDVEELKELIRYFLERDKERAVIAEGGYRRAHQEHTYLNRLRKIISIISK